MPRLRIDAVFEFKKENLQVRRKFRFNKKQVGKMMKRAILLHRIVGIGITAGILCALLSPSFGQAVDDAEARNQEIWREAIVRTDVPSEGCFQASYPSLTWEKIECVIAPDIPFMPRRGQIGQTVGNGNDYAAKVTSGLMKKTVGSFPNVTGVTKETGLLGADDYSLQINSNFMNTAACNGATDPAKCHTWEQFVYASGHDAAFIQYWLINYNNPCPSTWTPNGAGNCFTNSAAVTVPQEMITNLKTLKLSGSATKGGKDTLTFTVGTQAKSTTGSDRVVDLATAWTESEFNIIGDGSSSKATFNSGSSVTVKVAVSNGTTNAPVCAPKAGTTGETNNLILGGCSPTGGASPNIEFTEFNAITTGAANHESPSLNDSGAFVWSQQVAGACSGGQCWQVFERLPNGQPKQITSDAHNHTHPAVDNNGNILYLKDGVGAGPGLEVVDLLSGVENQIEFSSGNPPGCTEPPAGPPTCTSWRAAGQFFGIGDSNAQIVSYHDFCSPTCTRTFDVSGAGTFNVLPAGTITLDINSNGDIAYDDGTGTIFEINLTTQKPIKVASGTLPRINDQGDIVLIAGGKVQVWFHPSYTKHTNANATTTAIGADINNAGLVAFEDVDSSGHHQVYQATPPSL
jgi:hypothetical protein